jgi:branched-chain amino acid transport system permease protein
VAIRDAPTAAAAMGVAVSRHKVVAFAVSSAIAGFGGALLGTVVTHVGPFDFGLQWSITLILAVIVGGSGSIAGALFGAAFVVLVPAALSRTAGLSDLVFGISLVAVFVFVPGGLQAVVSNAAVWLRTRRFGRSNGPTAEPDDALG